MEKNSFGYKLVRTVSSPVFTNLYNPRIINKEFIPKNGSIILCGNHLHVWDQFPVICATKRVTHWMAKKEYFDGKLGPIFKLTGAISVDRGNDTTSATNKALEYLKLGSAIGIFPEGTRNKVKRKDVEILFNILNMDFSEKIYIKLKNSNELLSHLIFLQNLYKDNRISKIEFINGLDSIKEYLNYLLKLGKIDFNEYDNALLLPFKYGAVSMAKKTNSLVVPFGVTGDYKIGSKNLTVIFDEPFSVLKNDIEESNKILRNKVLNLVKKSYKK